MGYKCEILLDSLAPCGARLTTFEVTFPRIVLAELNTHRLLSRSSASSRAIPVEKRIAAVKADPFVPAAFGKNQKGMQAGEQLTGWRTVASRLVWKLAAFVACVFAGWLSWLGVHKQLANRLLEPFLWHTAIVTATEWSNFFALRCAPEAQPELRTIAEMMKASYDASTPKALAAGDWHLPYVCDEERAAFTEEEIRDVSVGRCARVSYLTHDGKRDPRADVDLARRIAAPGHMAPFEHVAQALDAPEPSGNFVGWMQYRKLFADEHRGPRRPDNMAPSPRENSGVLCDTNDGACNCGAWHRAADPDVAANQSIAQNPNAVP